ALVERLAQALSRFEAGAVTVAGGCACNTLLRRETAGLAHSRGIPALFPSPKLCRDNGAMIAYAGSLRLQGGQATPFTATAIANLDSFSSLPV
ncbi:MAG: hypothetical protein E6K76_08235, partial [Candidatus Eisenbacteria bacterium]